MILSIIKIICCVASCMLYYLVWKYLKQKALGMQTLLDLVIKDHILVQTFVNIMTTLPVIKTRYVCQSDENCNHILALIMLHVGHFSFAVFLLQIFVTIGIRYMSIFHQTVLNDIPDKKIIRTCRIFVFCFAVMSNLLDNIGPGDHVYAYLTNTKTTYQDEHVFSLILIAIVNLIGIIYVQFRIEFYTASGQSHLNHPGQNSPGLSHIVLSHLGQINPGLSHSGLNSPRLNSSRISTPGLSSPGLSHYRLSSPGLRYPGQISPEPSHIGQRNLEQVEEQSEETSTLDKSTIWKIIAIVCMCLILLLYWAISMVSSGSKDFVETALSLVIGQILVALIIPIILVRRNDNLCKFCVDSIKSIGK